MKRITTILAGALACAFLAAAGGAGAVAPSEPETPRLSTTCSTTSKNVIGKRVTVAVSGKDVARSQKKYAGCPIVRKVADRILSLRIEEPKAVEGFRCTPRVTSTEPDVVKYHCLFRGADTATEIVLRFTARYDLD